MTSTPFRRTLDRGRFGAGLLRRLLRARRGPPVEWQATVDRKQAFLDRARAYVALPGHPFAALLAGAGWPLDRLQRHLAANSLERTLHDLAVDGVRLDADEVKCRRPLVRGGRTLPFSPLDLEQIRGPSVPLGTSGTSGPRTHNPIDLDGFDLQASYKRAMLGALGALDAPLALYYPAPSAAGIAHLLSFALAGKPPDAWFCHLPEAAGAALPWSRWLRALCLAARAGDVRLPLPQLAAVEQPLPLVDWLHRHARDGGVVATFPGSALRLDAYAASIGRPLPPLTFILGGEPVTPRKRARLESHGHRVYPWYGAVDAGRIAIGCLAPEAADDMHLLSDRFAAVEWDGRLLLTSLSPAVHKRYLNTDCGDLADLSQRDCGCPLGLHGLPFHVGNVRSVQKLCLEGITLPADLVHRLAEEMLPAHCGGTSGDYQLQEREDDDGWTRLVVLVAPEVPVAADVVIGVVHRVLLEAAGDAPALAQRIARSDVVTVSRQRPRFSRGGKLLPRERTTDAAPVADGAPR
jgi:hypothetical protein